MAGLRSTCRNKERTLKLRNAGSRPLGALPVAFLNEVALGDVRHVRTPTTQPDQRVAWIPGDCSPVGVREPIVRMSLVGQELRQFYAATRSAFEFETLRSAKSPFRGPPCCVLIASQRLDNGRVRCLLFVTIVPEQWGRRFSVTTRFAETIEPGIRV